METPQQIGRYEVRRVVGRGGMAVVLESWDPVLHRLLAVKLVDKTSLDASIAHDALRRFKREAQAAARLTHPNVVQVYEYGEEAAYAWIAMEYVPGKPLTAYLDEGLRTEIHRVRDIVGQLLDALAYSHGQGVVHRDIKPANLLVTADGQIKVTDFGIARIEASNFTQRGDMLGTPSYMSPEQYMGEAIDGRSDIFSAGVILYELLTGERPFTGDSSGQIMQKILHEMPANPSELNPQVPPQVDWVVQKALAKDATIASERAGVPCRAVSAIPDAPVEDVVPEAQRAPTARSRCAQAAHHRARGDTMGPSSRAGGVRARAPPEPGQDCILFVDDEDASSPRSHHLPQQVPCADRHGMKRWTSSSASRSRWWSATSACPGCSASSCCDAPARSRPTACASCSPATPTSLPSSAPSTTARSTASSANPGTTRSCRR
jgi:serine/threonine protein kinase